MASITNELVKFNQSKSSSQALTGDASTIHFTNDGDLVLNGRSYIHTIGAATKNTDGTYTITGGALKQVSDAIGGETGLGGRVVTLEQKVDGYTTEGGTAVPGLISKVNILNGENDVEGSVKKQIKDAIEGLDVTDEETAGSVVVAVSETDGKVSSSKQTLSVTKLETPTEGQQATYDVTIGNTSVGLIDIPFCDAVLFEAKLSDTNATLDTDGHIVDGTTKGDDALVMSFKKGDGTFDIVKVNLSSILVESEFKNGLDVNNHEVSVKFGENNAYLGFGNETTGNKSVQAKIVSIANASSTSTGLVDANDAKTEISAVKTIADAKIASVKQSEEGQEVTVTTVTTKVEDVISSVDVTIGVSKATYAKPEGASEKTLSDAGLVDGATVKAFVADKVSKGSIQSVSGETDPEGAQTHTALVTATTNAAKEVTIASSQKLKDAVSKAETSIQGVTGESSTATYTPLVAVSQKDVNNAVVVSATEKLQTAVSKAEGSIQSVTGESDPEGTTTPTALITASTNQDNEVTITASDRLKNTINAMYWS